MTKFLAGRNEPKPTKVQRKEPNGLKFRPKNSSSKSLKVWKNEPTIQIGSEKLMKYAKELVKSHPELSIDQALAIEKQREHDRKRRAEEMVVDPYKSCRIEEYFEIYMKEADGIKNEEMKENWKEEEYHIKEIVEDMEEMMINNKENF
ncbi:hypothetical protein GCK72_012624 [Caenorhabditis remanei]|uniref:Uncharacterized protein n=1 Tax=Caenorhabditis remanei TaxID=31234 RepID=A0A6A5GNF5_CAERE|nr:hypothetical protein GCK72_012624 [Caenorhabditis remanei]KAF1756171.1 hypothetical protein GCK72_012624 [Caenorhabditis remanei]